MTHPQHDAVIVGAGPAGLAAALALRHAGLDAICVGPAPAPGRPDRRTTALLHGSVRFLTGLGVWERLRPHAAPLAALRLIDRTGRLFRAPDTAFEASEIGQEAFGYNIPNAILTATLFDALGTGFVPSTGVSGIQQDGAGARLALADGHEVSARLVVGADGRQSFCREAAGIGTRSWAYDQTATVCDFAHGRPHGGACTEFHYSGGPFTVVPLPGGNSSLVWVERPAEAAALAALGDAEFAAAIAARLDGLLGEITEVGPRSSFPLSGLIAKKLTAERLALVGEAGHVMPPIGAQGLNLGFRDVADLARCIAGATDPGAPDVLAAYEAARRGDVLTRTLAADLLNRTLTSGLLPLQLARGAGLMALSLAGPLRRAAMRRGMAAAGA
ncbi:MULTISPECIES: UbiH/UbiF family hydroxylase [Rhodomicrobium]|uniref:UbiH/UbiF family hydroxylase n=1 Tax=Rhodomicrobium TaxID=1068 RepID=UPI000B4B8BED|nr:MULTISPECIES: UbiH/UbiF family hydroxylase [Rhodomicrobium]